MLPKKHRLKKKKDFEKVIKKGKGARGDFLNLKFLTNNLKVVRVGFVVGQKISKKATVRNRVKRRLREVMRINLKKIKPGYDLIFFTRKGIEEKNFWEIKEIVEQLLKKAKLLKTSSD
jgi:ribonuclease P protein component